MPAFGQLDDFFFQIESIGTRFGAQPDGVNASAASKDLLVRGLRNVYTLRVTSLVPFVVEDAGNFHDDVLHANVLPHRIAPIGKQPLDDRGADHGDLADFVHIQYIQPAAEIEG